MNRNLALVPRSERLWNDDLAPAASRRWGLYSLFSVWMAVMHNVGGYTFALGFFFMGLGAWQVLLAMAIANTLVYWLMNLTGAAGVDTGVPYPVLARISFGVFGANLAALVRAFLAIFWYGIQTYLASVALEVLALRLFGSLEPMSHGSILGLSALGWICFVVMWAVQLLVVHRGMEGIRRYSNYAAPAIIVVMVVLTVWILSAAHWKIDLNVGARPLSTGTQVHNFFAVIALIVAFFGTWLLNFCDFSRFAPDAKSMRRANFVGLPVNFVSFAFIVVAITAGTKEVYGQPVDDPVQIVSRIDNTWIVFGIALVFTAATIAVNVVANFVSPAFDLSNVAPGRISFAQGGMIAAVLSVLVFPWELFSNPIVINYFIGGIGALLGPVYGVIIGDYYLLRRRRVEVEMLYAEGEGGPYWYRRGWNPRALQALAAGAVVAVVLTVVPGLSSAAPFSWFVGAVLSAAVYLPLMRLDEAPARPGGLAAGQTGTVLASNAEAEQ